MYSTSRCINIRDGTTIDISRTRQQYDHGTYNTKARFPRRALANGVIRDRVEKIVYDRAISNGSFVDL